MVSFPHADVFSWNTFVDSTIAPAFYTGCYWGQLPAVPTGILTPFQDYNTC